MNEKFISLQESLETFKEEKDEYDKLLDENEVEMLHSNRVIKKEVVDMSDLVEKLGKIILTQNQKIHSQGSELSEIKSILKDNQEELEKEKIKQRQEMIAKKLIKHLNP